METTLKAATDLPVPVNINPTAEDCYYYFYSVCSRVRILLLVTLIVPSFRLVFFPPLSLFPHFLPVTVSGLTFLFTMPPLGFLAVIYLHMCGVEYIATYNQGFVHVSKILCIHMYV